MLKRGENENKTTLVFWDSELRDIESFVVFFFFLFLSFCLSLDIIIKI